MSYSIISHQVPDVVFGFLRRHGQPETMTSCLGPNSSNKHQEFSSHQLLKRAKNPPTGHAGIEVAPGLTPSFQTRSGW